jgi:hypothetical protein
MTNEEIIEIQRLYKEFAATPAGGALQLFRNLIIRTTMYGEKENANYAKLRKMDDEMENAYNALVEEIKRLQVIEAHAEAGDE